MHTRNLTEREVNRLRVKMVLISTICCIATNTSTTWSIVSADLIALNGWSNMQGSIPYTVSCVVGGFAGILGGMASDSKHPGRLAALGGAMITLAAILMGCFSDSVAAVIIGKGFLMSIGGVFSSVGLASAAMKWYPASRQSKAAGFSTLGMNLSSLILSSMYVLFTTLMGFSMGFSAMGICMGVVCAIFALQFREAPQSVLEANAKEIPTGKITVKKAPFEDLGWKESLKTPQYIMVFATATISMTGNLAVASQVVSIINSLIDTQVPSWIFVALGGFGGVTGRLLGAHIGDKLGVFRAWGIVCLLYTGSLLLFPFVKIPILLFMLYIFVQFLVNSSIVYSYAAYGVLFSKRHSGLLTGVGSIGSAVSGFVGPTIASYFADQYGSYTPAFMIVGSIQLIAAALQFAVNRWYRKQ